MAENRSTKDEHLDTTEAHNHPSSCETTSLDCRQLADYLANDSVVYGATQIFDALSDFTRFQIVGALCLGDKSVSELQLACNVSQSAISHQLRLLRDRGLVSARRDGQRMIYSLADEHVTMLMQVGLEHASEEVGAAE